MKGSKERDLLGQKQSASKFGSCFRTLAVVLVSDFIFSFPTDLLEFELKLRMS